MARYLAVLVYRLLTRGEAWVDRGTATFERLAHRTGTGEPEIQSTDAGIQADPGHASELSRHPNNPFRKRVTRAGL
jgi:hypothetical protein